MANEITWNQSGTNNYSTKTSGGAWGPYTDFTLLGNYYWVDGDYTWDSAFRFTGINISQGTSVNDASIHYYTASTNGGGGLIKIIAYGIDEDNTSDFGGDPFGRTLTTASETTEFYPGSAGDYHGIPVKNEVNEILGRGGWSSGNAMGFIVKDNGTTSTDTWIDDVSSVTDGYTYLAIRVSSLPDFTPTPKTLGTNPKPALEKWGMKVSQTGVDVKSATMEQLYFTSGKRALKVAKEGVVGVNVTKAVAHQLGYAPPAIVFCKGGTNNFKLNRRFTGSDPITNGIRGFFGTDYQSLRIATTSATDAYYYIFVDPIDE